jgi:hypothetical protein
MKITLVLALATLGNTNRVIPICVKSPKVDKASAVMSLLSLAFSPKNLAYGNTAKVMGEMVFALLT